MNRPSKHEYYFNIAKEIATRSTCLRRKYGAIIVKNDEIIATGYNGAPRGTKNCSSVNFCYREIKKIPAGMRYESCRSVHAEMNAIISAKRGDMIESTMYLIGLDVNTCQITKSNKPCKICSRLIINAGIKEVIIFDPEKSIEILPVEYFKKEIDDELDKIKSELKESGEL